MQRGDRLRILLYSLEQYRSSSRLLDQSEHAVLLSGDAMHISAIRLRGGFLLFSIAATLVAGCASPGTIPSVTISPKPDTVAVTRNENGLSFQLTSVIANHGPGPVYVLPCGLELQRSIGGVWTPVWSPVCVTSEIPAEIREGTSLTLPTNGSAFTSPTTFPQLDPRFIAGSYRILWQLGYGDYPKESLSPLPIGRVSSSPFVVVEK